MQSFEDDRIMKKFLHVGCGPARREHTTKGFNNGPWQEIRFDIDPKCSPDILGTIVDMSAVPDASVDAIFSSHNIEHVYAHEVGQVLKEFLRVLSDDGFVILTCPDLKSVCEAIARDKLLEPLYQSPAGPIAPLDVLYGHRPSIAAGNHYMAHKCGFTWTTLSQTFLIAGFRSVMGASRPHAFDIWIAAFKKLKTETEMQPFVQEHLP
jgi:SAM-dependent methyltransferase